MKKILIVAVVLLCIMCLLLKRHGASPGIIATNQSAVISSNGTPPIEKKHELPKALQPASAKNKSTAPKDPRTMTPEELQSWMISDWQSPINFYGKVVDENSNAVAGAGVQFEWDELPFGRRTKHSSTESDANGLFSLKGAKGPGLDVRVSKNGYYTPRPGVDSFTYSGDSPLSPDPSNPVIFHLRKKGEGVPLIQADFPPGMGQIWQLRHDGTPVELDLLKGIQVPQGQGQLKLEYWRDLSNPNAKVYDWRLQFSIPGGGLAQTDEEFAFTAPEAGYLPSIIIDMPATNQNWQNEVSTKYYLKLPNGDYGEFDFYLFAYNGVFRVHSAVNPIGSRHLEPAN